MRGLFCLTAPYLSLGIENPRVGGSIPPPGTTFQNNINDLIFAH